MNKLGEQTQRVGIAFKSSCPVSGLHYPHASLLCGSLSLPSQPAHWPPPRAAARTALSDWFVSCHSGWPRQRWTGRSPRELATKLASPLSLFSPSLSFFFSLFPPLVRSWAGASRSAQGSHFAGLATPKGRSRAVHPPCATLGSGEPSSTHPPPDPSLAFAARRPCLALLPLPTSPPAQLARVAKGVALPLGRGFAKGK